MVWDLACLNLDFLIKRLARALRLKVNEQVVKVVRAKGERVVGMNSWNPTQHTHA